MGIQVQTCAIRLLCQKDEKKDGGLDDGSGEGHRKVEVTFTFDFAIMKKKFFFDTI